MVLFRRFNHKIPTVNIKFPRLNSTFPPRISVGFKKNLGCSHDVYADDIILLSASVINLQKMLNICHIVGAEMDVLFNAKKSTLFVVGRAYDKVIDCLQIGNASIHWCTSLKYLGIFFQCGYCLNCDIDNSVRRFYTAANAIVNHSRHASELSKLF